MVFRDPNPSMKHGSSHLCHDEDEALRVPPKQVDNIAIEIDKMHDWFLQENHNTDIVSSFDALKKVIDNDGHGINLFLVLLTLSILMLKFWLKPHQK